MPRRPQPLLVSVADAARLLAVSERTVERMLEAGELTRVRVRGSVRVERDELEALIRRGRQRRRSIPDPEPITNGQLRALHAKASDLDKRHDSPRNTAKRAAMQAASHRFGRAFNSALDLTSAEATWVLELLEEQLEEPPE